MKVVGLLSGGKDSCYNLLHCVQQGHTLVALATLSPPGSKDELDSYMYQTVGHDAVHLVAQAMDLPLYRRVISGTAINQKSEYGCRTPSTSKEAELNDETEDLYYLLKQVKLHHPDVEAVSVGAILSNYQRVRVEHVALRPDLGLTPLTFLWQRSQSELYAEILEAGLVSILIKVAGIGLDERDLGKTLGQMQAKLERLNRMYGAHVCGEGGEYETLTIDSPLFKKRVAIGETETVVHSDSGFGSVSYLRLRNARLVDKELEEGRQAKIPELLDRVGRRTLKAAQGSADTDKLPNQLGDLSIKESSSITLPKSSIRRKGRYFVLSNITGHNSSTSTPASVEDQVRDAFATASHLLSTHGLSLSDISHINLYLSSQAHFVCANSIYRTLFGVSPPTRACVALPSLPAGCDAVINAIAFSPSASAIAFDRRALHVQGRSFWAPANIGPYSQSLVQAEKIWVAGQIGLVPADLTLPEGREVQAALSIQHARRILKATVNDMGGRDVEKGWVEGGVCWVEQAAGGVEVARMAWLAQLSDDDDDDESEDEAEEQWLGQISGMPPMLFVTLPKKTLPRGAAVEWQVTGHTGRVPPSVVLPEDQDESPRTRNGDESDDEDGESIGADAKDITITHIRSQTVLAGNTFDVTHSITSSKAAQSRFGVLSLRSTSEYAGKSTQEASTSTLQDLAHQAYAVQVFLPQATKPSSAVMDGLESLLSQQGWDSAQRIPCSALHILDANTLLEPADAAVVWHGI